MSEIVVVTAAIGTTETPPAPRISAPGVRYVCATDRERPPPGWERWHVTGKASRMAARYAKMRATVQFHTARAVLWVDASFELLKDPRAIVTAAEQTGAGVVAFVHPDRKRITEEAVECARIGLVNWDAAKAQVERYRAAGFDTDEHPQETLTSAGLMVMRPSPRVGVFCRFWFQQIIEHTARDQLSIDFSAWRTATPIGYLAGHYRDNPFALYDRMRHRANRVAA